MIERVIREFAWVLSDFTGSHWVFIGFYRISIGFIRFNWVLLCFSGFNLVSLGALMGYKRV